MNAQLLQEDYSNECHESNYEQFELTERANKNYPVSNVDQYSMQCKRSKLHLDKGTTRSPGKDNHLFTQARNVMPTSQERATPCQTQQDQQQVLNFNRDAFYNIKIMNLNITFNHDLTGEQHISNDVGTLLDN